MMKKAPAMLVTSMAIVMILIIQTRQVGSTSENGEHPETERVEPCDTCHAGSDVTPSIVKEWYDSAHGEFLVQCFVCHGSMGEDFVASPTMDRCAGCHAEQVDTMSSPFMKDKTCFSCHPNHSLEPHRVSSDQGGES